MMKSVFLQSSYDLETSSIVNNNNNNNNNPKESYKLIEKKYTYRKSNKTNKFKLNTKYKDSKADLFLPFNTSSSTLLSTRNVSNSSGVTNLYTTSLVTIASTTVIPSTTVPVTSSVSGVTDSGLLKIKERIASITTNEELVTFIKDELLRSTSPFIESTLSDSTNTTTPLNIYNVTNSTRELFTVRQNTAPVLCNCKNYTSYYPNNYRTELDEFSNIWKLAFFVLAFLIGFISLLLILSFAIRILITKMQKSKHFGLNYDHQGVTNANTVKNRQISSISLFEFDPDVCSSSNCGLTISRGSDKNKVSRKHLSMSSSRSSTSNKKHKHSLNSRSTTITACTSTTSPNKNHYELHQHNQTPVTNEYLNPTPKLKSDSNEDSSCYIYGITNKGFLEDFQNSLYKKDKKQNEYGSPFECGFIPTSFRPALNSNTNTPNSSNVNNKNNSSAQENLVTSEHNEDASKCKLELEEADEDKQNRSCVNLELPPRKEDPSLYQQTWKGCSNDYEALETNTVTGSLANLSAVTTYSEVFGENKHEITDTRILFLHSNNNELISKSSKITQELEMRLKERRQLMESKSDKFQPKIIHQGELTNHQTISLNDLDKKLQIWKSEINSKSNRPNSMVSISTSHSCVCPCHSHKSVSQSQSPNERYQPKCTEMNHKEVRSESSSRSKKAKIIIDGSSTLPTKRESIRMLIENKAVSENKQKTALEMHLNTMLSSRANTLTLNDKISGF